MGDTMKFDILDDIDMCMVDIRSFFNILNATDWNEPTVVDIAGTGKTLSNTVSERVADVCSFVQKTLGRIEIIRAWSPLPEYNPGEIVGLKLTASGILNEVLREHYGLEKDVILEIKPVKKEERALVEAGTETKAQGDDGQQPESEITVTQ